MKKKLFYLSVYLMATVGIIACDKKADQGNESTATTPEVVAATAGTATQPGTEATVGTGAMISFEKTDHDFGSIKQGEKVSHTFKFTNSGTAPLLIGEVRPSCGCTTTNYTKEPVQPGGSGIIELEFDSAGKMGKQQKTTTVMANVPEGTITLTLYADIEEVISGPYKRQQ
jgi:hypothetical protein